MEQLTLFPLPPLPAEEEQVPDSDQFLLDEIKRMAQKHQELKEDISVVNATTKIKALKRAVLVQRLLLDQYIDLDIHLPKCQRNLRNLIADPTECTCGLFGNISQVRYSLVEADVSLFDVESEMLF